MKKTMQFGCALVLAFSTLPMVAQAAFTTPAPTLGEPPMPHVVLASNEGPGLNVILAGGLGGGSYSADPQVKDDLFAGTEKFEKGATDVTNVNLDGKTLGMVGGGDKDLGDAAHKLKFIVVHSYKYDKPGMYKMEDVEVFRKKLTDGSWNCFIHTKDKDSATDICAKGGAEGENREMVILTAAPMELTFVHLSGSMSFDDLGKMGGSMGLAVPPPPPPPPPAPHP